MNGTDKYNCTALLKATKYGQVSCVNTLITAGADVNIPDKNGKTALSHAVEELHHDIDNFQHIRSKKEECMKLVLKAKGANVNYHAEGSEPPLISVAHWGNIKWLHTLLKAGADVNETDKDGNTALIQAAERGHDACITALIKAGASVNITNDRGWTALMQAAGNKRDTSAKLFIESGADPKHIDKNQLSLLNLVASNASVDAAYQGVLARTYRCFQLFLRDGSPINTPGFTNALRCYLRFAESRVGQIPMLLVAAGEELAEVLKRDILADYLSQEDQDETSLKHVCRESIRDHLIKTNRNRNLFIAVPKLDIPSSLASYLLYDVSLDDEYVHVESDEYDDVDTEEMLEGCDPRFRLWYDAMFGEDSSTEYEECSDEDDDGSDDDIVVIDDDDNAKDKSSGDDSNSSDVDEDDESNCDNSAECGSVVDDEDGNDVSVVVIDDDDADSDDSDDDEDDDGSSESNSTDDDTKDVIVIDDDDDDNSNNNGDGSSDCNSSADDSGDESESDQHKDNSDSDCDKTDEDENDQSDSKDDGSDDNSDYDSDDDNDDHGSDDCDSDTGHDSEDEEGSDQSQSFDRSEDDDDNNDDALLLDSDENNNDKK